MTTAAQLPTIPAEIYVTCDLDMAMLTAEDKAAFVRGWENAGGYTDDRNCQCPPDAIWCMPWTFRYHLNVPACMSMEELGKWWWEECRDEVADMLRIGTDNSEWEEVEDWY